MTDPRPLEIPAADGRVLHGMLYPSKPLAPVLIINSATAVPQGFYRRFATHMQGLGWQVLTYDYRGIGRSASEDLRSETARLADWPLLDMQAALDFAENHLTTPDTPEICVVGHSAGGHLAGLMPDPKAISAMVGVSPQSGYWRIQGGWEKPKVAFFVYALAPLLTRLFGYLPWKWIGGEDLPKEIALDWMRWARKPGYLLDDATLPLEHFDRFTAPVLAYSVDDDDWGTERAVRAMMERYPQASFQHLHPKEWGVAKLGHMGAFRKGSEQLWAEIDRQLRQQAGLSAGPDAP